MLRDKGSKGLSLELDEEGSEPENEEEDTDASVVEQAIKLMQTARESNIATSLFASSEDEIDLVLRALYCAGGKGDQKIIPADRVSKEARAARGSNVGMRKKAMAFEQMFSPSSRAHELFSAKMVAMKLKNNVVSDFINEEYTHDRDKFKKSRARRMTKKIGGHGNVTTLQESFVLEPSGMHNYNLEFVQGQSLYKVAVSGALKKLGRFGISEAQSDPSAPKNRVLKFAVSPTTDLTITANTRKQLHIPEDSVRFCFAYPIFGLENVGYASKRILGDHKDTNFLVWGGFLYFSATGKVVAANALDYSQESPGVKYKEPVKLPSEVENVLRESHRFQAASRQYRTQRGVKDYAWVCPEEFKTDYGVQNDHGGFAFTFQRKEEGVIFLIDSSIDGIDMRGEVPEIGRRSHSQRSDRAATTQIENLMTDRSEQVSHQQFVQVLLLHDETQLKQMQDMVLNEWSCDIFKCQEKTGASLTFVGHTLLDQHGLMEQFNIPERVLMAFLQTINAGYEENPYHNAIHAADTCQTMNTLIMHGLDSIAKVL
jgi:hypothetical protein